MNLAQEARAVTGYTQKRFCDVFGIPLGTQRNYEQGLCLLGGTMEAYLELIKNYPKQVERLRSRLPKKN